MVPQCYILLCPCIWSSAAHYACFLFILFCNLKKKIGKTRCNRYFHLGYLNDHLFEIKFTFGLRLSICVCSFPFGF